MCLICFTNLILMILNLLLYLALWKNTYLLLKEHHYLFIGALQYLIHTCSNIAYIVNHFSQFLKHFTDLHWQAVKCVLRYLSGTLTFSLLFQQSLYLSIFAYLDSDLASNIDDHKLVVACCVFIGTNLISLS